MFWGVYGPKGSMLQERAFLELPGQSMTSALAMGVEQARASCFKPADKPISNLKMEALPRKGSTQYGGQ
jgi:hypothetical protein